MDYLDIEWFALDTNRDHSVVFETVSKYCISDSFVDYDVLAPRQRAAPLAATRESPHAAAKIQSAKNK